jgi:hypothetical protein
MNFPKPLKKKTLAEIEADAQRRIPGTPKNPERDDESAFRRIQGSPEYDDIKSGLLKQLGV